MSFYDDQILPRLIDVLLSQRQFEQRRAASAAGLSGTIVEIGFGSGRSVTHYPKEVEQVFAIDPSSVGKKLAARRIARSHAVIDHVGLNGEDLPLGDASVDHALSTWTLCTIADPQRAVREIWRVLKPGGTLHFVEHGRSPQGDVALWQDRLTPLQQRLAGGCHLNRQIDEIITSSGFELRSLDHPPISGPKVFSYLYEGIASKSP